MEKGSLGLGVESKKQDLLSSTVRLAREKDIDKEFITHNLMLQQVQKPQEYLH